MRDIKEIIIHCSDTPEGRETTVNDIDLWHKQAGYKKIGYHYVIYLDGSIHKGREENETGAHCIGHNTDSIGICYIGGKDKANKTPKDTRTEMQKNSLLSLLVDLKKRYPKAEIFGHKDFSSKDCPCFDAKEEYKNISSYTEIPKCKII